VAPTEAQPEPITEAAPIEAPTAPTPAPAMAHTITEPVVSVTIRTEAPKGTESSTATEAPADLATLKTPELRKLCSQRGITWRNALGANRHMTKAQMVEALAIAA
jgi:hypothetical protein